MDTGVRTSPAIASATAASVCAATGRAAATAVSAATPTQALTNRRLEQTISNCLSRLAQMPPIELRQITSNRSRRRSDSHPGLEIERPPGLRQSPRQLVVLIREVLEAADDTEVAEDGVLGVRVDQR